MKLKYSSLVIVVFLSLTNFTYASFTEVKLRLPQYSIIDALQDKQGYLWLATGTGLARYDGYGLKVYLQEVDNPYSLPANLIAALFEDKQGNLLRISVCPATCSGFIRPGVSV